MPAFFIFTLVYYRLKKRILTLSSFYKADLRALGLLRIGTALLVMADLLIRGQDLGALYTDEGIWPTSLIHNFGWQQGFWSLHSMSGSYQWELLIWIIHFAAAVFLLMGYHTRIAAPLTWLLMISLHNRNLFVLQSGDDLLRLVLLWGCFLPWGQRYSLDAKKNRLCKRRFTLPYLGYLLLLASVYFFTVCLKNSAEWRSEGSAIYYALSLEQLRLPFTGDWLYQFPLLMKILTWIIFYAELLIPILVLWPSRSGKTRLWAFGLFVLIHLGIALTLYVGLFFIISIVTATGLLPGSVMDRFEKRFRIQQISITYRSLMQNRVRHFRNALCVILVVLCLILNLSTLKSFSYELRPEMSLAVNTLRLNQYWGMFSPSVMKTDGWFVYFGIDSIGRQWDLRRNEDYVDFSKPGHIVSHYKSDRWRKLAENMQDDRFTFLRPLYCKYILARWNREHPEKKILTLNLYFMEKKSLPDYRQSPIEKKLFCVCIHD